MYVQTDYHGRGIGKLLIKAAIPEDWGCVQHNHATTETGGTRLSL